MAGVVGDCRDKMTTLSKINRLTLRDHVDIVLMILTWTDALSTVHSD